MSGAARAATDERATILVVDDNPGNLLACEAVLEALKQRIEKASTGARALELAAQNDCAVVILDYHLPDMSGLDVARVLRERSRHTPIIFVTGEAVDSRLPTRVLSQGAVDFLIKPFDPDVLRSKVRVFVELHQQRERIRRQEVELRAQAVAREGETQRTRLVGLFMEAPAAIAITRGPELVFEYANRLYEAFAGHPIPLGRPLREAFPELAAQPTVMELLERVMRTGEAFTSQELPIARAGAEAYFNVIFEPIRETDGAISGLLTHAVEVTELVRGRRVAEAAAAELRRQKEALERWELVFRHAGWGIAVSDADGRIEVVNPAFATMHGEESPEAFVGRPVADLIAPQSKDEFRAHYARAREQPHYVLEHLHVRKDGSAFPVRMDAFGHRDADGRPVFRAASVQDLTTQREAEAALRAREADFRRLAESIPDVVIRLDREGRHLYVNPAFERLTGRPTASLLGKTHEEIGLRPAHCAAWRQAIDAAFAGEEPTFDFGVDGAGGKRIVQARLVPERNDEGAVVTALAVARDVTDERRREEALRASELHFRQLADAMPQLVWTAGPSGVADYYNARFVEYSGRRPEDLKREGWGIAVHPDDVPRARAAWMEALAGGTTFEVEFRFKRTDGCYRWFLARAVPIRDEAGRLLKWFGTTTDINDQKEAEEAQQFLADVSKELAGALDYQATLAKVAKLAVPRLADWCAIDLLDRDGQLVRLAVEHPDPEKLALAHELHRRYPPNLSAARGVAQVLRTGEPDWLAEIPDEFLVAAARDEEHLRIARGLGLRSYVVAPLKTRGGILGAMTFVHAESGRRYDEAAVRFLSEIAHRAGLAIENARLNTALEARVRERTAQLEDANRELESFSYSVSHDLRAPLRHIMGFAQLLDKRAGGSLDQVAQEHLRTIVGAAQQGGQLVDDLLAFSRMGRTALHRTRVDLGAIVAEVRRELARDAEGRTVTWRVGDLPVVRGDPALLRLVLVNLLSNALKYTRPRAEAVIEVSGIRAPSEVEIVVRDNGVGFDMQYGHKLFGVFQRLHTAEQFEGTGIGLANVRRIVARHGGRTWAEGTVGEGATFHFTLPVDAAEATP